MVPLYLHEVVLGHLNGDGFDDLFVLDSDADELRLYLGSAAGLSASPDWTHMSDASSRPHLVDLDEDGLLEAIAPRSRSAAHIPVFGGSATGLSTQPTDDLTRSDPWNLSSGDVDGDGFDDFAVGEPGWIPLGADSGRVRVYRGSAAGPVLHQDRTGGTATAGLGVSVAGADVNGDGYADLLLGSLLRGGQLHLGSATGLDPVPSWDAPWEDDEAHGHMLTPAGDVNAGGLDDVIARPSGPLTDDLRYYFEGAGNYDGPGSVRVFLGAAPGLEATTVWRMDEGWGARCGAAAVGDGDKGCGCSAGGSWDWTGAFARRL